MKIESKQDDPDGYTRALTMMGAENLKQTESDERILSERIQIARSCATHTEIYVAMIERGAYVQRTEGSNKTPPYNHTYVNLTSIQVSITPSVGLLIHFFIAVDFSCNLKMSCNVTGSQKIPS